MLKSMTNKPSKRSGTKLSKKLKETAKALAGGDVREFEELYEEPPPKRLPPRKPAKPATRRRS